MIAALALLAPCAPATDELPRRAPIAHVAGFESVSAVRFASEPERLHRLVATHVFPARVRWSLTLANEPSQARAVYYRAGAGWFAHDEGSASSRELTGEEREQIDHFFALRQALILWPNGFAWRDGETERRARIEERAELVAVLGADARPASIAWVDGEGRTHESLRDVAWRADGGRAEPASFALARFGDVVWREEVRSVEFELAYLDDFFRPADRRARTPETERLVASERVDVPALYVRRLAVALDDAPSWDELVRRVLAARGVLAEDPSTLGLKLDEGAEIELDAAARPSACLARLAEGSRSPEWTRRPGVSALSLRFDPTRTPPSEALARLSALVPEGARAGQPYVRIGVGASGQGAQLVLPLLPPR